MEELTVEGVFRFRPVDFIPDFSQMHIYQQPSFIRVLSAISAVILNSRTFLFKCFVEILKIPCSVSKHSVQNRSQPVNLPHSGLDQTTWCGIKRSRNPYPHHLPSLPALGIARECCSLRLPPSQRTGSTFTHRATIVLNATAPTPQRLVFHSLVTVVSALPERKFH